MNEYEPFVDTLRRRTRFAYIKSSLWQLMFALGLVTYGWYFPSFCGDCSQHPILGYLVAALAVCGGIAWVALVIRGIIRRRRPEGDPVNIQLSRYGSPEGIAQALEEEFGGQPFRRRKVYVGRKWLCYGWKKQVTVCRLNAIVWAYMERIRRKLYMIIPIGTTNQMVLWSRDGRGAVLPLRTKSDVVQALETLHQAAPWTFIGYTDALKESWNNDRDDLLALFDSRQQPDHGLRMMKPEAENATINPIR